MLHWNLKPAKDLSATSTLCEPILKLCIWITSQMTKLSSALIRSATKLYATKNICRIMHCKFTTPVRKW